MPNAEAWRRRRAWRIAAAGVVCVLAVATLAAALLPVGRDAAALEAALESRGAHVLRSGISAAPFTRGVHGEIDAVVIVAAAPLPDAEQRALRRFVEDGGTLVLASSLAPSAFLGEDPLWSATPLPGRIYGEDGGPVALDGDAPLVVGDDLRTWDLTGSSLAPTVRSSPSSFRDTNGNSRLDAGEPAGPFTVSAETAVGSGRLVLLGVRPGEGISAALAERATADLRAEDVLLLAPSDGRAGTWGRAWLTPLFLAPVSGAIAALCAVSAIAGAALLFLGRDGASSARGPSAVVERYRARLRERATDRELLARIDKEDAP